MKSILDFKYAYICFLRYINQHPGEMGYEVFNDIDGFELKKQAVEDNLCSRGRKCYSNGSKNR